MLVPLVYVMSVILREYRLCCIVNSCEKLAKNTTFLRNLSVFYE
jgi:hypothetical protein